MYIEYGVTSDKGLLRSQNEDNYLISSYQVPCMLAVCDGMGGMEYGQEASRTAVRSLLKYSNCLIHTPESQVLECLENLVQKVNLEVAALTNGAGRAGTTLAMAYISASKVYLANVGDTRIYLYKNRQITQLSVDHNRMEDLKALTNGNNGHIKCRGGNELTQFLGIEPEEFLIEPHYEVMDCSNMVLLLCSDGVTGVISDEVIAVILSNPFAESMEQVSRHLVEKAIENGSKDNVTAIVVKIEI